MTYLYRIACPEPAARAENMNHGTRLEANDIRSAFVASWHALPEIKVDVPLRTMIENDGVRLMTDEHTPKSCVQAAAYIPA